jgi:hypothetical protein
VTERNQQLNEFSLNISMKGLEDPNAVKAGAATAANPVAAPSSRDKVMQAITK